MSLFSITSLLFYVSSVIFVRLFSVRSRKWTVLLCNAAFLYLLKPRPEDIAYLVLLVINVWLAGKTVSQRKEKTWSLVLAVGLPVTGLCVFKYAAYIPALSSMMMPLGLSFYTFRAVSYLAEIKKGNLAPVSLPALFDYIVFFPFFQAGPIHRPGTFFEQLRSPYVFEYREVKNGFVQAMLGLFQKFVIADELAALTSVFLGRTEAGGFYALAGMILYSFEIYVDFDSYSNIAIGTARMLGFHVERNFHTPYLAVSVRDFWNRWHMSLSGWLRDYIYIPLGGSRRGLFRKYLNTLAVFLVSGMWHGSTAMFLIWGLGHGLVNILEDLLRQTIGVRKWMRWFAPAAVVFNFAVVSILWVFFRASSLSEAFGILSALKSVSLPVSFAEAAEATALPVNELYWLIFLLAMVFCSDLLRYRWDMIEGLANRFILFRWLFYTALIAIAIVFGVYGPGYHPEDFIYVTF